MGVDHRGTGGQVSPPPEFRAGGLFPRFCCYKILSTRLRALQDAQLSQRDRAAGYISFGRKWKTGTQRQYFTDIVSLASTTVT